MHKVTPYKPKVRLIGNGKSQEIIEFENYDEFLDWVSRDFIRNRIVNKFKKVHFKETRTVTETEKDEEWWELSLGRWPFRDEVIKPRYVLRDEFGSMISVNEAYHDYCVKKSIERKYQHNWTSDIPYTYRKDPVPDGWGTHYRGGNGCRTPKLTQELRRNCAEPEFTRGRRTKRYLPDTWIDNISPSTDYIKNWKQSRKTQWK